MAESNLEKSAETAQAPVASSPDELIKDLNVTPSTDEQNSVVGGYVYHTIKLTNATITK